MPGDSLLFFFIGVPLPFSLGVADTQNRNNRYGVSSSPQPSTGITLDGTTGPNTPYESKGLYIPCKAEIFITLQT